MKNYIVLFLFLINCDMNAGDMQLRRRSSSNPVSIKELRQATEPVTFLPIIQREQRDKEAQILINTDIEDSECDKCIPVLMFALPMIVIGIGSALKSN